MYKYSNNKFTSVIHSEGKFMSEIEPSMQKKRYIILIAGVIIQFCAGIIYMWSVFNGPVAEYLGGWDTSAAKLTASFMLVAFVAGILIGGRIMDKIGPRTTCLSGAIMMSVGILASSFVTSSFPELIYVTYGLIGGFGVGVVYTCTVSPIQKWFYDRKGFATGVMVGAFGFSLVIFGPLAENLLPSFGVPATFQMFGIAFLILCIPAALLIKNPTAEYINNLRGPMSPSKQKQYTTKEMLRTRSFYLITFSLFFVLAAFFIMNPAVKELGNQRELGDLVSLCVPLIGICSASGRLFITWVSDKIGRMMSLFFISGMTIVGSIGIIFAEGVFFLICLAVITFAFGGAAGIYATVTSDHFGAQNMGSNYGFVMLGFGASALVFPFISNILLNGGTDYTMSFVLAAVACVFAIICVVLLRKPKTEDPVAEPV